MVREAVYADGWANLRLLALVHIFCKVLMRAQAKLEDSISWYRKTMRYPDIDVRCRRRSEDCIGVSYVRVYTFMVSKSKARFKMIMYNADFIEVRAS